MRKRRSGGLYRHTGVALLRAAALTPAALPVEWPDPDDSVSCRRWLERIWAHSDLAAGIRQASPVLAQQVQTLINDAARGDHRLRAAVMSTTRYVLRAVGRPTPFGLFAGVSAADIGPVGQASWRTGHRAVARIDTQCLADVVNGLESDSQVLARLEVVSNNLVVGWGRWLEAPVGPDRVRIRRTEAIDVTMREAADPIPFARLAEKIAATFGTSDTAPVTEMLAQLVSQGLLITCLRAPYTVTDPLAYLLEQLTMTGAAVLPHVSVLAVDLALLHGVLAEHNDAVDPSVQARLREQAEHLIRRLTATGRTALAVDLVLDAQVRLPEPVVAEVQAAAEALMRLGRHPDGLPAWRAYHTAFLDQYGTGVLVPVARVTDPGSGIGLPAGYPGSVLPALDPPTSTERDQRLLEVVWRAVVEGADEVLLTDEMITEITGLTTLDAAVPPHIEIAARVHADHLDDLHAGDYTVTVGPARAGGVLTSRFTTTTTGSGLESVYAELPPSTDGALPVQLSFPPAFAHSENVCRVPAYLPDVVSMAEFRRDHTVKIEDLAVLGTPDRLYLVHVPSGRVVEPQVFHALALDKQPPPLARFLAHIDRGFCAWWTVLDFGPGTDELPFLPRVRYGRTILAPARWRIAVGQLPAEDPASWDQALAGWRRQWRCPPVVDLRDDDRSLRLDLDVRLHVEILREYVERRGSAVLTDAVIENAWIDGHAHEVAVPLQRTRRGSKPPVVRRPAPVADLEPPGGGRWYNVQLFVVPERMNEIIAHEVPALQARLDDAAMWFVRYRNRHVPDHLRLRLRPAGTAPYGRYATTVADWADHLHRHGLLRTLTVDTYAPETGRYGEGPARDAAETVFVTDSEAVVAAMRQIPDSAVHPSVLIALGMTAIADAFLGDAATDWLRTRPAHRPVPRDLSQAVNRLALAGLRGLPAPDQLRHAWTRRSTAVAAYRQVAPDDTDRVLESLLHMHHNRIAGVDTEHEAVCWRLARQIGVTRHARRQAGTA
ncbi:lantibiotic dehydratase [Actinoplanes sp. NPDC051861]|uniref:lantibiotic dehydratase n=1 Tax=Actinoplanes sp. NPDC051861 TaxID=3155170 RepID=UPI003420E656